MSRQCKAYVSGNVAVTLVCDQCSRQYIIHVRLEGTDPECLEWEAVQQGGWYHADDCIVCSEVCLDAIWNDWGVGA